MLLGLFFVIDDDDSDERQYKRASKKAHRKDFIQRIHFRNGNAFYI
jgi:hypothetical protein